MSGGGGGDSNGMVSSLELDLDESEINCELVIQVFECVASTEPIELLYFVLSCVCALLAAYSLRPQSSSTACKFCSNSSSHSPARPK